ncbi:MAG TPA: AAA family ATPase [Candidatus Tectomicrobia bacterium]|jgi:type II secretory pathway predicted ATPase ExeA
MSSYFSHLQQNPFTDAPDPASLLLSPSHNAALQSIINGLEAPQGGVVILGPAGLGKTTLLHAYLDRVHPQQVQAIYISFKDLVFYSNISLRDILGLMYRAFGLDCPTADLTEMIKHLHQVLLAEHTHGRRVVLLIDQAHIIPVQTLQELLLLARLETAAGEPLLRFVFAGLPTFQQTLNRSVLRQLKKRLATRVTLVPLTSQESLAYLRHRLAKVQPAATDSPFTPGALQRIIRYARGNPRMLHVLCDNALRAGVVRQQQRISPTLAEEVIAELRGKSRPRLVRWGGICTAGLLVAGMVWRAVKELNVYAPEKPQGHRLMHCSRRAVVAGMVTFSLFGVGVGMQSSLLSKKLRAYTAASVPSPLALSPQRPVWRDQPILPQRPVWRDQPILPHGAGWPEPPKSVQWQQPAVSYQLPSDKPFVMPLPQLQYTPDHLAVTVTLDASSSLPMWLKFDPDTLTLSGMAPPTATGKTYHLTFRAHTADGHLESLLNLTLTMIARRSMLGN